MTRRPFGVLGMAGLAAVLTMALAGPVLAAQDFPPGYEGYHTYAELSAELQAMADAHPDIVRLTSIGTSYQGRQLWLVKISDHPELDEDEPEALLTGLTHAREHLSLEQALAVIHWLVDGYGTDGRVTSLVNGIVLWVIPMVNPDGGEFDIHNGRFHAWRKNRQPTPGSTAIGTDLNRNYGYRWDCCGGSSDDPFSLFYHGPAPFSAPETAAIRAFILSRRVSGVQRIRIEMSFHSAAAKVLYPYGYTTDPVPPDMRLADHRALSALAHGVAARDGYEAMQASHWYITDGSGGDWAYGRQGILPLTMELPPRSGAERWYPKDDRIVPLTQHNRGAILWFLEQAACPYAAAGLAAECGSPSAARTPPIQPQPQAGHTPGSGAALVAE